MHALADWIAKLVQILYCIKMYIACKHSVCDEEHIVNLIL